MNDNNPLKGNKIMTNFKKIQNFQKTISTKIISGKMKIVFLAVLIFLTTTITAQWNSQSPIPTHLDVRGVGAPSADHIFIATDDNSFDDGGALFESTDGGLTWVQRNIPISLGDPFNGLFFLDNQNGWAFGNDNYRTTDGGATWTQLPFLGSTYFMKFYSTNFGLATGNFDRYVSYNGGDSWTPSPHSIFAFDFMNDQIGLGVADTALFLTLDGVNSFTQVYSGTAKAVAFLSNSVAIGIVDDTLIRSTDGGNTWNSVSSASLKTKLFSVSQDVCFAWGRSGTFPNYDDSILRSVDGGQSWINMGEIIPEGIFAFAQADQNNLAASDLKGNMFYSSDAGSSWSQIFTSPGLQPSFLSSATPYFADSQTGYFGYGSGFVIKTTNAGASWFQISSGTGNSLNDIDRFANGDLIAVGDDGIILKSDGLSPWTIQSNLTNNNFNAVQIISSTEAAIVDETGQVYLSTDGGGSWTATPTKPSNNFEAEDVHFTSSLDGWVIGFSSTSGSLFHTTDGGSSWQEISTLQGAYVAIDIEGNSLWAQNVGGIYFRSTDNGINWIQGELPGSNYQISDIDFIDESIGYAVGWWGEAFRTNDGGVSWEILPTPNSDDKFTDIYLIGPDELWVSTTNDVVYYSATAGQSWSVLDIGSNGFGTFSSIAAFPGGDAWVVGFQGYIEHFTGPPPPPANQLPVASFEFSTTGLTVDFTDTSIDPDGFIVSWEWNFGDGTTSNLQNPTHTYDTADTYIVSLTVTDNDGGVSIAGHLVVVQPGPGGTFGNFTEVTPLDSLFITPQDEDFWVITTAPADYDNDGDLDIAVLGYYVIYNVSVEYKLVLLRNEGSADSVRWDFSYIDVPFGNLSSGASDLSWGDFDNDTDLDLVVGTDGQTVLYRNDSGNLVLTNVELPGYWEDNDQADFDLRSISWADYDNDGDQDLIIPSVFDQSNYTFRTALIRNDGLDTTLSTDWIFTETDSVFSPTSHAQTSWADYDGDQDLDLLLINVAPLTDDGFIKRYRNDGNGVFTEQLILGTLSVEHGEAQWGDYDGDGDLDILVAGNLKELDSTYTHMALRIYENENENYLPFDVINCIPCEGWYDLTAATWADYDSDGDMDILLAGTYNPGSQIDGRARIYTNSGGFFTADTTNTLPAPRASGSRGGTFSWFDLDGDSDLDYFIAGQYFVPGGNGLVESQMHLYRNDVIELNEAPSIPSGITATAQSESSVHISWNPSFDDHTPSPAITYDLVIVRRGTHVPIGKMNNDENPLLARLPEPGNISAVTNWTFNDLEDGIYEWRLRAVDAAYAGSEIAMGEFGVGVVSVDDQNNTTPEKFSLEQNYPNPFNPSTIIRYSIPESGKVTIKIYNTIGKEMTTLVNENKQPGNYEIRYDASKLSSGVYFYKIESGRFIETKKMILLK